ncbi:MAG: RNA methyltransferase [bacterium]|nr:MAG: RNA methyltransferase [bacterium]
MKRVCPTGPGSSERLKRVSVVLCRPRYGGNVGSAARAVGNMGLGGLILAAPEDYAVSEARMFAASASEVLESARTFDSLEEALEGQDMVLGASRRVRSSRTRIMTPREASSYLLENLADGRAAVVFGPEDSGLSASELSLCHGIVSIPADAACPSLNLAQAVMVLAYELRVGVDEPSSVRSFGGSTGQEREQVLAQMSSVLERSGFFIRNPREKVMVHLREILSRGLRTSRDARIMRGVFRRIAWAMDRQRGPGTEGSGENR